MKLLLILASAFILQPSAFSDSPPIVETYFAPGLGPLNRILTEIKSETQFIRVQEPYFNDPDIIAALCAAQARKVDVQIILDATNAKPGKVSSKALATFRSAGIPVFLDGTHKLMHEKKIVFGALKSAIDGSYNFTKDARKYAELLHVHHDPITVDQLLIDWINHSKEKGTKAAP